MSARVAVILFPGSNCENDVVEAVQGVGGKADIVWHRATSLAGFDAVVIPGGFAHGDYLRPGAIARFSEVMGPVGEFARAGGPVVGICNGFQVLTEAHLLPGALQKNAGLKFICKTAELEVVSTRSALTNACSVGDRLMIPINHFEGNYTCSDATYRSLVDNDQIVVRYVDNPNGSVGDIAGISSVEGNVVGLMPHPERASHPLLGSTDGRPMLRSILAAAGVPA